MKKTALLILFLATVSVADPGAARAGQVSVGAGLSLFNVTVTSIREAKYSTIVKQAYDFSCGSAAVATLLTYHYDNAVEEKTVFEKMWADGDREVIETKGFSLLDMRGYLETRGFGAEGFKAPLSKLQEVGIPAIALINLRGYLHFVVIKGITEDEVLVGDPAKGIKAYTRGEFEKMWNGILFVITSSPNTGRDHFNFLAEWKSYTRSPLGLVLPGGVLSMNGITMPRSNEF